MKNGKPIALLVGVLLVLAGTLYTVKHLRDQEQQAVATYDTESPRVSDIVLKTLASGSVQPRQEILIKPQVSGIVRQQQILMLLCSRTCWRAGCWPRPRRNARSWP